MRILATLVILFALGPRDTSAMQGGLLDGGSRARGTLEGRITTLFGESLPGARVAATYSGLATAIEVLSSKDGTFRLKDLPPGRLHVQVAMPGFEKVELEVTVHSSEIERLDLGLQLTGLADGALCRVHGRVLDAKGRPAAEGSVAGIAAFNTGIGGVASIDGGGKYDLSLPVPAHYVVLARRLGGPPQAKVLTCRADQNTDQTIDFLLPDPPAE